jgi:hypothetical protein
LTDQQLALQNAMNQQLYGQNQSLSGTAAAGYTNLLANPGYSDAEKSAITNQSMGALASTFAALASSAANRIARTRNSAGYGDLLDALAQEQGRQTSSLAQQPTGLRQPGAPGSAHRSAGPVRPVRREQLAAGPCPGHPRQSAQRARQRLAK